MNNLTPENINVATWKIPSPLGIIGSHANGEFNGMTASWITQVSMNPCLLYTSPSPRDMRRSRMPSSA